MTKDKLIELFVECYNNCELTTKIDIHNIYVRETSSYYDDEIAHNDDEFFNMFFENNPSGAVRASSFGDFRYNDDWVWFNGYGNLETGNYEDQLPLRDAEDMAEWYIDHYDEVDYITEMVDFCNECEEGVDEEEEEEGNED